MIIPSRVTITPALTSKLLIEPEVFERNKIVGFNSYDSRSRSFNLLRSQVTRQINETGSKLFGVTSATPAAGKTFVSINLAAALSQIDGRSVILCDLDLRRGSLLKALEADAPVNLGNYFSGENPEWMSALYQINDTNLFVIPTVADLRGSSELLSSNKFRDLIAGLRSLPDEFIVICDLPPVFANDDAMLCMQRLDGYYLVVEQGRSTAAQVTESIALLQPSPCLGTIFNRYQGGFADDYGYGYGDSYGLKNYGKTD